MIIIPGRRKCLVWPRSTGPSAWLLGLVLAGVVVQVQAAGLPLPVAAPSSGVVVTSPAPVTPTPRIGPRLLTPGELRDGSSAPGELGPEHRITPQIRVPLGKTPARPTPPPRPSLEPDEGLLPGDIDAAELARCDRLIGEQVRVKCRYRIGSRARVH
jgi:hypothetical protein